MITKIELTQDDIIDIIADHFNVAPEDISIIVEDVWASAVYSRQEVTAVIRSTKRTWGR